MPSCNASRPSRYSVLITIPDSKGKAVKYFSPGQTLAGLVFMKLTSVTQMFRFRQNREFFNPNQNGGQSTGKKRGLEKCFEKVGTGR